MISDINRTLYEEENVQGDSFISVMLEQIFSQFDILQQNGNMDISEEDKLKYRKIIMQRTFSIKFYIDSEETAEILVKRWMNEEYNKNKEFHILGMQKKHK